MNIHTFRSLISAPAALRRGAPRRGQALLLAVLVMIFAALIGSTFITVLALNIDRTSAQEQRVAAANAARNGLEAVNYQLVANGSDWRPEQIAPPPAPGDVTYNFYYTPQEISQGFARYTLHPTTDLDGDGQTYTTANPDFEDDWIALENAKNANPSQPTFVKFPDPRIEQVTDVPTYLAEVRVEKDTINHPDKVGMLRMTVVGASPNDPNVLVPRVSYKSTLERNSVFSWGLVHTGWNYQKNTPTWTEWKPAINTSAGATSIIVEDATGISPGRLLTLQQGATNESVMVAGVNSNTITFKGSTTQSYLATLIGGAVSVRAATTLMNELVGQDGVAASPSITPQFDADGETASSTWEQTQAQEQLTTLGCFFNTDLVLQGKADLVLGANQQMKVTGLISTLTGQTQARLKPSSGGATSTMPTSQDVPTNQVGSASLPNAEQARVYDNPYPASGPVADSPFNRSVRPQIPPDINQFTKLQDVTKYAAGGAVGLGPGLFINNSDDVEQVAENGILRALSVSDFHRLGQGKSLPSTSTTGNVTAGDTNGIAAVAGNNTGSGHRLVFPNLTPPNTDGYKYPLTFGSLEQRGIRGWISTFEFLPRGALIELNGSIITVTLDDRSDAYPDLPDPSKAWPWASNAAFTTVPLDKCYRMEINALTNARVCRASSTSTIQATPSQTLPAFNGIIYAEGNVRVRGTSGAVPITIVSMGNIYVEGELKQSSATGLIGLIAKKNVVFNPTQIVTRVAGSQDRAVAERAFNPAYPATPDKVTTSPVSLANPVTVDAANTTNETQSFRVGDLVRVGVGPEWRRVEQVNATSLSLVPALTTAPTSGTEVRILTDPAFVAGSDTTLFPAPVANVTTPAGSRRIGDVFQVTEWFYRMESAATQSDVLARDIKIDNAVPSAGSGGSLILSARMVGERKEAASLRFTGLDDTPPPPVPGPLPAPYSISAREDTNNNGLWEITEDIFKGSSLTDTTFPFSIDLRNVTGSSGGDTVETVAQLKANFNTAFNGTPPKWSLADPDSFGSLVNGATGDAAVAARYLARIGHLNGTGDDVTAPTATTYTGDEVLKLPITVSVGLHWLDPQISLTTPTAPLSWIGTNPTAANGDDVETSRADFYWFKNADSGNRDKQQWLRWISRPMVAPAFPSPAAVGSNVMALVRSQTTDATLPPLRVGGFKLERDDFKLPAHTYGAIPVEIQATIFAQEGSWFVIAAPQQHRTDENSNGSNNARERAFATRMNRTHYEAQLTGRIVQNYAPTGLLDYDLEHSPDNRTVGAMAQWIDALSYPATIESDGVGAPNGPNPRGRDWKAMRYNANVSLPPAYGGYLPLSPGMELVN